VREIPAKKNPSSAQHGQKAVKKEIVKTQKRRAVERGRFAKRTMKLEEAKKTESFLILLTVPFFIGIL
jgi:hypothetical protein